MVSLITLPKLSCKIKEKTGIECPGCGIQRSIELLVNGEFLESIKMYPGLFPLIATFMILIFHIFKGNNRSLQILKISFIFTLLIISISYILKFISHE